jgi:hypothetical protein
MDVKDLVNLEQINIKDIPDINEKWIEDYIASDPKVLRLGDLELKTKQKIQPNAGRLDILLQDPENDLRYEVEIQLGKTDASHIIRTIEYWDIERKRYPQYDHCAVIIAEDITSRFFNIVQLFNGFIPLIAIQMKAYKIDGKFTIIFTKILDKIEYGDDDDEGDTPAAADINYWIKKSSKESVEMALSICDIVNEIESGFSLIYNKCAVFLSKNGTMNKFAIMFPKKSFLRIDYVLDKNEEIDTIIEKNEFDDSLGYNVKSGRYRIKITKKELSNKKEIIKLLLEKAYKEYNGL